MTERMTDERWQMATGYTTPDAANAALLKQAETIQALADALEGALSDVRGQMGHRVFMPDGLSCSCEACQQRLMLVRKARGAQCPE